LRTLIREFSASVELDGRQYWPFRPSRMRQRHRLLEAYMRIELEQLGLSSDDRREQSVQHTQDLPRVVERDDDEQSRLDLPA